MKKLLILFVVIFCCLQQSQTLPTRSEVGDYLTRLYQGWRPQNVDEPRDWPENAEDIEGLTLSDKDKRTREITINTSIGPTSMTTSSTSSSAPTTTTTTKTPPKKPTELELLAQLPGLIEQLSELLANANKATQTTVPQSIAIPVSANPAREDLTLYPGLIPTRQILRPNSRLPVRTNQFQINGGVPIWADPLHTNAALQSAAYYGASSLPYQQFYQYPSYYTASSYPPIDLFSERILKTIFANMAPATTTTTTTPKPITTRAPGPNVPWFPFQFANQGLLPIPSGTRTRWQLVLADPGRNPGNGKSLESQDIDDKKVGISMWSEDAEEAVKTTTEMLKNNEGKESKPKENNEE